MQTVVFYWLKGHSGAAPNEFADLHATKFLSDDVCALRTIPLRRHASMTFAFDRKPFQWAAIRIGRHVREIARAKSSRSEWLGVGDWDLRWQKVGHNAELQRVLQGAQTKRLLLGGTCCRAPRAARTTPRSAPRRCTPSPRRTPPLQSPCPRASIRPACSTR
jgi:hypothetical protein